ncbi:helix-turn-helix domain-containing protein [Arthrobacter sp. TMN-50]
MPDDERIHLATGFGRRLKDLRAEAGLSQDRASELAGMHRASLANLENGRSRPTADSVRALAAVLAPPAPLRKQAFHELRKLAGKSWRTSHKRRAPLRPAITVRKADWNLKEVVRTARSFERAAIRQQRPLTDREREFLDNQLRQARADLGRAQAFEAIGSQLLAPRSTVGELIEDQHTSPKDP